MRLFLVALALISPVAAMAGDISPALTPGHVQAIFSARGANPGAVFVLGDAGRYVLRSLSVSGGHNGEFEIHIKVDKAEVPVGR